MVVQVDEAGEDLRRGGQGHGILYSDPSYPEYPFLAKLTDDEALRNTRVPTRSSSDFLV